MSPCCLIFLPPELNLKCFHMSFTFVRDLAPVAAASAWYWFLSGREGLMAIPADVPTWPDIIQINQSWHSMRVYSCSPHLPLSSVLVAQTGQSSIWRMELNSKHLLHIVSRFISCPYYGLLSIECVWVSGQQFRWDIQTKLPCALDNRKSTDKNMCDSSPVSKDTEELFPCSNIYRLLYCRISIIIINHYIIWLKEP